MELPGAVIRHDAFPDGWGLATRNDGDGLHAAALRIDPLPERMPVTVEALPGAPGPVPASLFCDPWDTRRLPATPLPAIAGRVPRRQLADLLRRQGRDAARAYHDALHTRAPFVPGDPLPAAGKAWGPEEMENLVEATMDFWLTAGRFNDAFESRFAGIVGRRHAFTANSGSSANLLALTALTSPLLGDRRLRPGDEVLTVAAGFPTTIAPILQNRLVPVFVDVDPATANALPEHLDAAAGPRTRAVMLAHTLGNPFDVAAVLELARRRGLWVIEDSCDALGSVYTLDGERRPCGSFGDVSTFSFYPAHHLTMGEGGAAATDDATLAKAIRSFRDWGRDCWCPPGRDDTCGKRQIGRFGELPEGYDHKYVYSHWGYNLKITDFQAAVGLAQLDRLDDFAARRRRNFARLARHLSAREGRGWTLPKATPGSDPCWFGFLLLLDEGRDRAELLRRLAARGVGTRLLFAGNVVRQPCFPGTECRIPFPLAHSDLLMERAFWVGVHQGLDDTRIDALAQALLDEIGD